MPGGSPALGAGTGRPAVEAVRPHAETAEARWVPANDVAALPLHPGFAVTWPALLRVCLDAQRPR